MFSFMANHPVIIMVGLLWIILIVAILLGNHGASIVSGNHEDPLRDVGNGGCTEEGSREQFEIDHPVVR